MSVIRSPVFPRYREAMPATSAGLLLYRVRDGEPEVLLVHPGGPFWARKDEGAWSLPKGEHTPDEEPQLAARREFEEELGSTPPAGDLIDLGEVRQRGGKVVHAWALEGDFDPTALSSNTFETEWPPRSGQRREFPEVDRAEWFAPEAARRKINPAQAAFVDRLLEQIR
jgi:predicted NUDIX family NTP pyrophosphohydrolase